MFEMPKKGTLIAGVPFDPRKSGNKFEYIVYPDSAPSDWVEILKNQGYVFVVSPLHDKDISANGEPKKAHYHVLVVWTTAPTKWQTACGICETLNCPCCLPIANLRTKYDYLTHKNDANKAQYDPKDIVCVNGFSISNFEGLAMDEVKRIVIELTKLCFDECITEYSDLMHYLLANEMHDAFDVASNRTVYFSNLCKGIWRKGANNMHIDTETGEVLNDDTKGGC